MEGHCSRWHQEAITDKSHYARSEQQQRCREQAASARLTLGEVGTGHEAECNAASVRAAKSSAFMNPTTR